MVAALASTGGEGKCVYRIVMRKSEGKKSHGTFRLGWEDNIKMNLKISVRLGFIWLSIETVTH